MKLECSVCGHSLVNRRIARLTLSSVVFDPGVTLSSSGYHQLRLCERCHSRALEGSGAHGIASHAVQVLVGAFKEASE